MAVSGWSLRSRTTANAVTPMRRTAAATCRPRAKPRPETAGATSSGSELVRSGSTASSSARLAVTHGSAASSSSPTRSTVRRCPVTPITAACPAATTLRIPRASTSSASPALTISRPSSPLPASTRSRLGTPPPRSRGGCAPRLRLEEPRPNPAFAQADLDSVSGCLDHVEHVHSRPHSSLPPS